MLRKAGFTMIELLVVIVVIGMLTGLSVVGVSKLMKSSKGVQRDATVKIIKNAVAAYRAEYNEFPFDGNGGSEAVVTFGEVANNRPRQGNAEVFMKLCGRDTNGGRDNNLRAFITDTSVYEICQGGKRVQKLDEALAKGGISSDDMIGFTVTMEKTKASRFRAMSGRRAFAPITITFDLDLGDCDVSIPNETNFAKVIQLN